MQVLIKKLLCTNCKKMVTYKINKGHDIASINGIKFDYIREYAVCDECGKEMHVPGLDDRNEKVVEKLFWEKKGIGKIENTLVFSMLPTAGDYMSFYELRKQYNILDVREEFSTIERKRTEEEFQAVKKAIEKAYHCKISEGSIESLKEQMIEVPNPDFPNNCVEYIKSNIGKADMIFVGPDPKLRAAMVKAGIDFYTISPSKNLLNEWIGRLYKDGYQDTIEYTINNWDKLVKDNYYESCGKALILLEAGEYVTPGLIAKIKNKYDKY